MWKTCRYKRGLARPRYFSFLTESRNPPPHRDPKVLDLRFSLVANRCKYQNFFTFLHPHLSISPLYPFCSAPQVVNKLQQTRGASMLPATDTWHTTAVLWESHQYVDSFHLFQPRHFVNNSVSPARCPPHIGCLALTVSPEPSPSIGLPVSIAFHPLDSLPPLHNLCRCHLQRHTAFY